MFRDNYTNFSFNDLHSKNFKVWITNKNDLKRNMTPNFTDKFNTPTYGQVRYYEGTTIDKQDITFNCVAINITANEWRAITNWLSPLAVGKLRFDWNPHYYYVVKLSKAITGEYWALNNVDPILGNLYNVTFSVSFSTVYDWAAMGSPSESAIHYSIPEDNIKDNWDEIVSAEVGNIFKIKDDYYKCIKKVTSASALDEFNEEYWTPVTHDSSIFNNSYLVPTIIKNTKQNSFTVNPQSSFRGEDYTIIQTKHENFNLTIKDINYCTIGTVDFYSGELIYTHYIVPQTSNLNNIPSPTIGDIYKMGGLYYKYNGSGWDAIEDYSDVSWEEKLSYTLINKEEDKLIEFILYCRHNEIIVSNTMGKTFDVFNCSVPETDGCCFCQNVGSYDIYPKLYSNIPYSLRDESLEYCSYEYNGMQSIAYNTILNSQYHTLQTNGIPIDALINNLGIPVYTNIKNNHRLIIPSGRPQLLKVILNDAKAFSHNESGSTIKHAYYFEFLINDSPVYNRYRDFVFTVIKTTSSTNIFDQDEYGSNIYSTHVDLNNCLVVRNPVINYESTKKGWKLKVVIPAEYLCGNLELSSSDVGKYFYVSLCDSYTVGVKTNSDSNGAISIELQPRDVI